MGRYITDEIGDEYQDWEKRNIIFLTAPTGSGKTTFVLNKLVEYAESRNAKILYLVNRKILKKQIEDIIYTDIRHKVEDVKKVIKIKTYQELEATHTNGIGDSNLYAYAKSMGKEKEFGGEKPGHYDIVIADECHYFFTDSTYNPRTAISYEWIMYQRRESLLIFMSATIDRIKEYIIKSVGYEVIKPTQRQYTGQMEPEKKELRVTIKFPNDRIREGSMCVKEYGECPDHSQMYIHILEDIDDMIDNVKNGKGKWMIFVDSIKKGKYIHRLLSDSQIDSVFIDAKWADENNEILIDTIETMVREQNFEQQVVVSTSVIDNGVSVKDIALRNMVVMADTKEQFVQMLGRKRLDDSSEKNLNLYILKRNKSSFVKRLQDVERNIKYIGKYYDPGDKFEDVL